MAITHLYRFENNANDSVGANNGTPVNLSYGSGFSGLAGVFDENRQINFSAKIMPVGAKTISFLFNNTYLDDYQYVYDDSSTDSAKIGIGIRFQPTTGNILFVCMKGTSGVSNFSLVCSGNICDGKWNSIIFCWDGTTDADKVIAYINGKINATTTALSTDNTASYNSCIGMYAYYTDTWNLHGKLDDFKIDNTAWSTAKIKNEYSRIKGFF